VEVFFLLMLLVVMAVALGSGFPVAFALPGAAIITIGLAAATGYVFEGSSEAYFVAGGPYQWLSAGVTNLRGVYWEVERDTLIAIPLFIFMGIMLQRSKIAEDLLMTMAQLFGGMPGGLGISVVFVGALLAATTGIVGATVVAMGLISLPTMLRNNYSPSLASGAIAASGTLGQIIPPSIVLIILADQLASATDQDSTLRKTLYTDATGELSMPTVFDVSSTSAGEMFLGAFVPGLVLVALYMLFILVFALLRPKEAPPVPYEGVKDAAFWGTVLITLIPPLALIFLVLGSIIGGIATVNQAGAIGAAGAMIMAGYRLSEGRTAYYPAILAIVGLGAIAFAIANYPMNIKAVASPSDAMGINIGVAGALLLLVSLIWSGLRVMRIEDTLQGVMVETAKTTSLVFIILLGAAMLTAAFRAFGGEELVKHFLESLPGGFWTQFVIVMLVIFILGFFLDFIEIAVVVVPIVSPILLADPAANITAVWLGVMIGLNIQTSFLTPPFGFALFYLRGVAPAAVRTVQIYKGVIAFIALQLVALAIAGFNPQLVNYLPNRTSLLSDTAPPPRNPRIQYCLTDYVTARVAEDETAIRAAISQAQALDLGALSEDLADDLRDSFDSATDALDALAAIGRAEAAVSAEAGAYRPALTQAREIQKRARALEAEIETLRRRLNRLIGAEEEATRGALEAEREALIAEREAVLATIPDSWPDTYDRFRALTDAENDARNRFARSADAAVEAPAEVLAILADNAAFAALEGDLRAIRDRIESAPADVMEDELDALADRFGDLEGAGDVRSPLNRARRALRGQNPDVGEALERHADALAAFEAQQTWRGPAAQTLAPALEAYLAAMRETVGARQQPSLTRSQALFIAACSASHRDLSLNF